MGGGTFLQQNCISDCRELILYTSNNNDAQTHAMIMMVKLIDYPEIASLEVSLTAIITPCQVLSLDDPAQI